MRYRPACAVHGTAVKSFVRVGASGRLRVVPLAAQDLALSTDVVVVDTDVGDGRSVTASLAPLAMLSERRQRLLHRCACTRVRGFARRFVCACALRTVSMPR